jgi:NTP pyrophosphatase (non-canonical NTP hydrolase)
MSDIKNLQQQIAQFSKERDWDQFHNGKDLAIGLSIEASELLEAFLWKNPEDVNVEKVKEELADVFNYALQIATKYDLNVKQIVEEKLAKNAAKYPVEKAKGVATKYDEL